LIASRSSLNGVGSLYARIAGWSTYFAPVFTKQSISLRSIPFRSRPFPSLRSEESFDKVLDVPVNYPYRHLVQISKSMRWPPQYEHKIHKMRIAANGREWPGIKALTTVRFHVPWFQSSRSHGSGLPQRIFVWCRNVNEPRNAAQGRESVTPTPTHSISSGFSARSVLKEGFRISERTKHIQTLPLEVCLGIVRRVPNGNFWP